MSLTLEEALRSVELEAGRTYRCTVNGRTVVVKVIEGTTALLPDPFPEPEIMLSAWVDFPLGKPAGVIKATRGKLPPPDPFVVEPEDEGA